MAGITCDHGTEMMIHCTDNVFEKVLESIKYFTNVFDPYAWQRQKFISPSKCLELIRVKLVAVPLHWRKPGFICLCPGCLHSRIL